MPSQNRQPMSFVADPDVVPGHDFFSLNPLEIRGQPGGFLLVLDLRARAIIHQDASAARGIVLVPPKMAEHESEASAWR